MSAHEPRCPDDSYCEDCYRDDYRHVAKDHRSPLARARDRWFASEEAETCQEGTATGQYLKNRLEHAFIAGYDAALLLFNQEGRLK